MNINNTVKPSSLIVFFKIHFRTVFFILQLQPIRSLSDAKTEVEKSLDIISLNIAMNLLISMQPEKV
jgi:hypothetical protein